MFRIIRIIRASAVGVSACLLFASFIPLSTATSLKSGEWYIRLIAEAPSENLKDQGNVLGKLRASSDQYDLHDLKELAPFSKDLYLTIVFQHKDWGEKSGKYASDYHKRRHWRKGDEWEFLVRSDTPRQITLSWEGSHGLKRMKRMRLVDLESGKTYRAVKNNKLQTYTFTMANKSHRFKWVYKAKPKS